jgi:spore germination protein YaaH
MIIFGLALAGSAGSARAAAPVKVKPKPKAYPYVRIFYYQKGKNAKKSFFSYPKSIDVFAPQVYTLDADGILNGIVDDDLLKFARKNKIKVMPLITNKRFNEGSAHALLDDPARQDSAISALIAEARDRGYWGWQFDFEQMNVSYRDTYSAFIKKAGERMREHNLVISVAVVAQISQNSGDYPRDLWQRVVGVYDYAALGASTDFMSVMSYDDPESKGPIARYSWVKKVIEHSLQFIPKEKLSLGIPLYMWRWDDTREKIVGIGGYKNIANVRKKYKIASGYNALEQAPFIRYSIGKNHYTIWYENAKSIAKKIELISEYGLHGFSAWALGLETPDIHRAVKKL